jgi:type IV pilus assembly protein PilN
MLRINLLPIKAARKHDTAKHEIFLFGGGLLLILVGLFAHDSYKTDKIEDRQSKINRVRKEIAQLKQDVVRVEEFKKKTSTLESKIEVIRSLQSKRIGPSRMLDEIATILTEQEKVWLTRLAESKGALTIEGGAMEHEDISSFQLALERRAELIGNVRLTVVNASKKGRVSYLEWKMVCNTNYRAG